MAKKKAVVRKPTAKQILDDINSLEGPKLEESREWLAAKQELDQQLGLAIETTEFLKSGMVTEPFGASNFLGTRIGFQTVGGEQSDKLGLIVLVKRKDPDARNVGTSIIPKEVQGKPTDVQIEDAPSFLASIPSGSLITGNKSKTGTLGCVVKLGHEGNRGFILSNQHVLARPVARRGDRITKQGREIATLSEWVNLRSPVFIDAALALITSNDVEASHTPHFTIDPKEVLTAELNQLQNATAGIVVKKVGGVSGITFGRIMSTNRSVDVNGITFLEQITVDGGASAFSTGGDSGSLVVTHPGNRPVGLLFAGSGRTSYVNRIENVMGPFGISAFVP